jgi:peptidoglycan/LPS O-acetylase OafA/YrhL
MPGAGIVRAYKNPQTGFDTRSGGFPAGVVEPAIGCAASNRREAAVTQRTRVNLAVSLLTIAIIVNLILLFSGDTSPGWPLAAVILLGASALLMLSQRREP